MKVPFSKILVLVIVIILNYSCNKNESELSFGEKYINSQTSLTLIDTVTVEFSTMKLDSIITSNTDYILVGHSQDDNFGEITSTGFFELIDPGYNDASYAFTEINSLDVYDSAVLILNYSNSYGDTTHLFSITVHQLMEQITLNDDGYLYNVSSVKYDFQNIGQKEFLPKPYSNEPLEIKISDMVGEQLYNWLTGNNIDENLEDDFIDYFNGLALVGSSTDNNSILSFLKDSVKIRVFAHDNFNCDPRYYDFTINNSVENQFNKIEYDYSNTNFCSILNQRDAVKAIDADGYAYIQAGTGVGTLVKFPYLNEILLNDEGLIIKAELVFSPKKASYQTNGLTTDLIIYKVNKYNDAYDILYQADDSTIMVTSVLVEDDMYNENTMYSFDISSYILDGIENKYFDVDKGLLISFYNSDLTSTFKNVLIDTREFKPQLKFYLLKY